MKKIFFAWVWISLSIMAWAQAMPKASPEISLKTSTEEGKKVLVATVKLDGKPLVGAKVAFFVGRTFGRLPIGQDETIEDGTAATQFPEGLPGGPTGGIQVIVELVSPAQYSGVNYQQMVQGGAIVPYKEEQFPEALWSPRAPLALILVIAILIIGVWSTYSFVFYQLYKIRKGVNNTSSRITD